MSTSVSNSNSVVPTQCAGIVPASSLATSRSQFSNNDLPSSSTPIMDEFVDSSSAAAQQIQGTESSSHFANYSQVSTDSFMRERDFMEDFEAQTPQVTEVIMDSPRNVPKDDTSMKTTKLTTHIKKTTTKKEKKQTKNQAKDSKIITVDKIENTKAEKEKHKKKAKK